MKWFRRALIVCIAVVGTLALVEGILRVFPPRVLARLNSLHEILLPHDVLGYAMPPNLRTRVLSEDGKSEYLLETNELGLRDAPWRGDEGRKVILGLGDSYLFGDGVNNDETVMSFLQRRLDERRPGEYRTINAGVQGYSTNQEILYYLAYGDTLFHPSVVLLFFYINDVTIFVSQRDYMGVPIPDLRSVYGSHAQPSFEWQTKRLFKILMKEMNRMPRHVVIRPAEKGSKMPEEYAMFNRRLRKEEDALHPVFPHMLTILKTFAESRGAKLLFVYVPSAQEVVDGTVRERIMNTTAFPRSSWDWDLGSRGIGRVVESVGIPYVNLVPAFREHWNKTGREVFIGGEGHFSPEGCRLAAEIVQSRIEELSDPAR